jgi:thioredoxin 1
MTTISAADLKNLQNSGEKILIQYTASWCGPCRALTPKLANMSNEYEKITFAKIDVEENQDLAADLGIKSVPTVIIYDGSKIVNKFIGLQQDKVYKEALNAL